MSCMVDVYDSLKQLKYFIDNEYLLKYSQLIERNRRTHFRPRVTHKHHIVPKSWYKLTSTTVNNELNNLVNLSIRDHFIAHYYLCLCTVDPFRYANELALVCLQSTIKNHIVDSLLLHSLPLYNNIYEDYVSKLKSNYRLYESKEINDN